MRLACLVELLGDLRVIANAGGRLVFGAGILQCRRRQCLPRHNLGVDLSDLLLPRGDLGAHAGDAALRFDGSLGLLTKALAYLRDLGFGLGQLRLQLRKLGLELFDAVGRLVDPAGKTGSFSRDFDVDRAVWHGRPPSGESTLRNWRDGLLEYRVRNPAVARAVDPVQRRRAGSADRDDGAAAGRARHRHGRRRGPPARARTRPRRLAVEPDETARKVGDRGAPWTSPMRGRWSLVAKIRGDKDVSWRLVTPFGVKRLEPDHG